MIKNLVNKTAGLIGEHKNEILIGTGIVGMVSSTIMAVTATPKALRLMEDKKEELGVTYLTKKEMVQTTWKQYAPAAAVGVMSIAGIVVGTSNNVKKQAALATVYAVSETTLKEYKRKTAEIVGEDKAKEIDREVAKARVRVKDRDAIQNNDSEYVPFTGFGDTLIYDSISGRYFRSNVTSIERAVNQLNKRLLNEHVVTLNDLYNEMNVPTIGAGNLIGWKVEREMIEVSFDSDVDNNGNPYIIMDYTNRAVPLMNSNGYW